MEYRLESCIIFVINKGRPDTKNVFVLDDLDVGWVLGLVEELNYDKKW